MFRGRKSEMLPTASYSSYDSSEARNSPNKGYPFGYGAKKVPDGSGRGIRMEAPIVRAWRNSSIYTKATYYAALATISLIVWGYFELRGSNGTSCGNTFCIVHCTPAVRRATIVVLLYVTCLIVFISHLQNSASIWLTCHAVECTLEISPPKRRKSVKFKFSRKQLVKSQTIKVDKYNNFVALDTGKPPRYSTDARRTQSKARAGPDVDGNYDSYTIHLRPPIKNEDPDDATAQYEVDLHPIEQFTSPDENSDNRVLNMRSFNLGQTKRRTSTMTGKVDSYILQRRHQLMIKENAALTFMGIMALVLGLFGILMTALVGQLWDEDPKKTGGPGTRRTKQQMKKVKASPGKRH